MIQNLGTVKPGSTLEIFFDTFAGATGASITLTGLAVTDIEVYKNGGTTQRSSDNGYTLLDTDGIDFDAITGIHGFSISLADNSDAGFYVAGGRYTVVVSSVTVDGQTVNFAAATFRIGYPDADLNTTIATLSSQTSFTLTDGPAEDDALNGCLVLIHDIASAVQAGYALVLDYTGSTKTVTLAAATTFTVAAGDNISLFGPRLLPTTLGRTLTVESDGMAHADVKELLGVGQSVTDLKDFADDGYDPATNKVQGVVLVDTLTTYTGNTPQTGDSFARIGVNGAGLSNIDLPNQTIDIVGNITGNLSGSVGSVTAGVTLAASAITAIWAALTSALTTVGSIGKLLVDNIDATISSRLATAGYTAPPSVGAIADQVWDEALAGHVSAGSTGEALSNASSAGDPWGTALPGAYGAGTAGNIVGNNLNATVSSRAPEAGGNVAAILADTNELQTDWANGGRLDLLLDAVKAKTDQLTFTIANKVDSAIINAASFAQAAADLVWGTAARTLTAFGFSVTVGTNNDKTGYSLATPPPTVAEIADGVMTRPSSAWEASAPVKSLGTAVMKATHRVEDAAGTLNIYRSNGSTVHASQTLTTDPALEPIEEITGAS